jgi:hypothetical protein
MKASKLCTMPCRALARGLAEAGFDHAVLRHGVDDQVLARLQAQDELAQRRVGQRHHGLAQRGFQLLRAASSSSGCSACTMPPASALQVHPAAGLCAPGRVRLR